MLAKIQSSFRNWQLRLRHVRLQPYATNTEEGRAQERIRRISLTALATLGARILAALTALLAVPLTIGYLGTERYGLWVTVSTTVAMMSFADLGIGNGLVTKIAEADGRRDRDEIRRLVSSATAILGGVSIVLSFALLLTIPHIDCAQLVNVRTAHARAEVPNVILTLGLVTFLSMPFGVVVRVQNGLQQGYESTLWSMAGTVLSLVSLIIATRLHSGLVGLVIALAAVPAFVTVTNFGWYFLVNNPGIRPRMNAADISRSWSLLRIGLFFVALQLAVAFAFLSDNIVVAHELGAEAVSSLAVPAKLFSLALLPVAFITGPLWPAFGEAWARGDSAWIARVLRRATLGSVSIALFVGVVLVAVGGPLVRIWTRGIIVPSYAVLVPLAIWAVLSAWGYVVAAFLNGTGQIIEQTVTAVVTAAVAFALKWWFIRLIGAPGVVWATIGSYSILTFVPLTFVMRSALRRLKQNIHVVTGEAMTANIETSSPSSPISLRDDSI